jgi:hypothetical protein
VSAVPQRSEKQEDVDQLVATFVDPGVSVQLENANNQILYGRRGTGKTHVLKVVLRAAEAQQDQLAIYVDMRNLGSSSIYEDEGRPMHVRVASLLRDVLAEVENALLDWATDPAHEPPGPIFERLNEFSEAITRSVMQPDTITVEGETSSEASTEDSGRLRLDGPRLGLEVGGTAEARSGTRSRVVQRGRPLDKVLFQEISTALAQSIEAAGISRLVILLDEWTAIPLDLQPLLAEFLKRAFFPNAKVTVKIASLEYRSNFAERMEKNNVLGFELSADISSALELDDYYVYDRNPARTVEMFSELAYRHISAEVDASTGTDSYLATTHKIQDADEFIESLFSGDAFTELVRAGEGVARDFINIFSSAFFDAVRRDAERIDMKAVRSAAREWYEKDKSLNVDEEQARVLRRIIESVIGDRKARSFMVEKDLEKHEVLRSLFDFRLIHLVQRGYADKDNPGVRYNIFTLDYGTYVDLIGTKRAPEGDFTASDDVSSDDIVVPFDDKRSIRRIILHREDLEPTAQRLFEVT